MQRLTRHETADATAKLRSWRSPADVDVLLDDIREKAGFYTVAQGGLKFWREAFVGRSCAYLSNAKRFRLGDDPPDFELDYGDHARSFEIVDVMPSGRQRGLEYDNHAALWNERGSIPISHLTYEQENSEREAIPADVERQILAKKAKKYDPAPILVLCLHHHVIGDLGHSVESAMVRHAENALTTFPEIWLLKGPSLLRVSAVGVSRV